MGGEFFVGVWPPNFGCFFLVCTNCDYTELGELICALSLNSGQASVHSTAPWIFLAKNRFSNLIGDMHNRHPYVKNSNGSHFWVEFANKTEFSIFCSSLMFKFIGSLSNKLGGKVFHFLR